MMESLKELLMRRMVNPEALSSAGPLLIVVGILVLYAAGLIFVILRTLRAPKLGLEAPVEETKTSKLTFLNSFTKFRTYLDEKVLRKKSEVAKGHLADIASLKLQVERLVEENIALRNAPPVIQKVVQKETVDQSAALEELQRQLDLAEQRAAIAEEGRKSALAKTEELEKSLKDMMVEIDNMYEQNAKALEQANTRRVQAQKRADDLELEISQMKNVLRTAKDKIVALRKSA